jgi:8-oxo-dGTP pyrophosphatase MutT (NUDIX family)
VLVRARGGDGSFLFPKGHVDPGETDEQAACREIKEEAGLQNLELLDDLGMFERHAINQDGSYNVAVLKQVHMFLFAAHETTLAPTMEMEEARWVPFREMGAIIGNEKERAWFSSVSERVREAIQRD